MDTAWTYCTSIVVDHYHQPGPVLVLYSYLGGVTYVLVVARTGTPTVPTALGVPYGYTPAVTRVLGPTIAMSVTILKL